MVLRQTEPRMPVYTTSMTSGIRSGCRAATDTSVVRGISRPGSRLVYSRPVPRPMASTPGNYSYSWPSQNEREIALATIGVEDVK